ncbi:hypothetical protein GEMRC1_009320 [Eukaryota sp. GEM-RC1]
MFGTVSTVDDIELALNILGDPTSCSIVLVSSFGCYEYSGVLQDHLFKGLCKLLIRPSDTAYISLSQSKSSVSLSYHFLVNTLWCKIDLSLSKSTESPFSSLFSMFKSCSSQLLDVEADLSSKNEQLTAIQSDVVSMKQTKEKISKKMKDFEDEMYRKFCLLLNEKKEKIKILMNENQRLQEQQPSEEVPEISFEEEEGPGKTRRPGLSALKKASSLKKL